MFMACVCKGEAATNKNTGKCSYRVMADMAGKPIVMAIHWPRMLAAEKKRKSAKLRQASLLSTSSEA